MEPDEEPEAPAGPEVVKDIEIKAPLSDGKIEAANMMTVTMSCDHRVIDGATGARFLGFFRQFVEDPAAMLL